MSARIYLQLWTAMALLSHNQLRKTARLPPPTQYPKPNWHSKSRYLLLLIKLEGSLELTKVLNRLYFCRVGQAHKFPSSCNEYFFFYFISSCWQTRLRVSNFYSDWCYLQIAPKETISTFLVHELRSII